jgi:hypothetical protein
LTALNPKPSKQRTKIGNWLQAFLFLPAAEALLAIGLVFGSPSEGTSAWLLGLSAARWLLVAVFAAIGLAFATLFWFSWKKDGRWVKFEAKFLSAAKHPIVYAIVIGIGLILTILSFYLSILAFKFTDEYVKAWLLRLFPALVWIFLFSFQSLIIVPLLHAADRKPSKFRHWPTVVALAALFLISAFIGVSGLGLQPDRAGWDTPGVPLLATQILFAWVGAVVLYAVIGLAEKRFGWNLSRLDLAAAFALWVLAIWLWQSQPLTPTFFSPTPGPPNYEYYPYSDAATHDLSAQSLIVGEGFNEVVEKPLYSSFLSTLHTLVGQDYLKVVAAQIVVLALFPAVLFFLGSRLHHQLAGLLLALAIIFREQNAIALSGDINVSHSKLLMTDLPAALGVALLALLAIRWLQVDRRDLRWPLWIGGTLGLLTLLRSQVVIFLPFALVIAFWQASKLLKPRLVAAGLLLLGFLLAAFPWMLRNYTLTGQLGYSQPLQALYLAKQYSLTPELADPGFPEGTQVSEYPSLGISKAMQFTLEHPGEVARFVTAHFFHNGVSSLLALPMRFDLADKAVTFYNLRPYWIGAEDRLWTECCSLNAYVETTPYWSSWDGQLPADAWLPLTFDLLAVAIGIGAVWKQVRWLTLVPIGIYVIYDVSTAIARVSGWRLILPVDWVLLLFYCAGIAQLTLWVWTYFFPQKPIETAKVKESRAMDWRRQRLPYWTAAILVAGLALPLAEMLVPARYPESDMVVQTVWSESELAAATGLDLHAFLMQKGAKALLGRALYPHFYGAGTGEPGGVSASNPQPFSRTAFWVVGPEREQVALPLAASPASFPNGVDVLVLGCGEQTYFRAAAVVFLQEEIPDLLANNPDAFICPAE